MLTKALTKQMYSVSENICIAFDAQEDLHLTTLGARHGAKVFIIFKVSTEIRKRG